MGGCGSVRVCVRNSVCGSVRDSGRVSVTVSVSDSVGVSVSGRERVRMWEW